MKRKESQQLYKDIYDLCIKHPEYQSNDHISEFLGRFLRLKFPTLLKNQELEKEQELKLVTKIAYVVTSADRVYRKVRETEFKHKQNITKQQIKEQETMMALDYVPWADTDIKKLDTL